MIEITPLWFDILNDLQFFEFTKMTIYDQHMHIDNLLQCGDIESNPGPAVMSIFERYNNSSSYIKHHAQGISDSLDSLSNINNFLNTKLPILMTHFEELIENIDIKAKVQVNEAQMIIKDADEKIKEDIKLLNDSSLTILDKLEKVRTTFFKLSLALLLLWIMYDFGFKKTTFVIGGMVFLKLLGVPKLIMQMIEKLFKHEAQSYTFSLHALGPIVVSLISYYAIGKLPRDSSIENFSKKINNMSRGLHGALTMKSDITNLWDEIKKFCINQISDVDENFLSMEEELKLWADDIAKYTDMVKRKECMIKHAEIIKIASLYQRGIVYQQWAYRRHVDSKMARYIIEMTRHAGQLYKYADTHNTLGGGHRQRPLSIVLFGESQIGKSCLIQMLSQDICFEAGFKTAKECEEQIFARQPETEYWDGYNGQYIVVRDDCLAQKDESAKPNPEIFETIREMNDFPYHLHMAALEDKNTFYNSKVSIMTVNDINTPIKSLSYPEAFWNRLQDNLYEVIPADEFAYVQVFTGGQVKRTLDMQKVRQLLRKLSDEKGYEVTYATEIYRFKRYVKVTDNCTTNFMASDEELLDYEQFSNLMCSKLGQQTHGFEERKNFLSKRWESKPHKAQVYDDEFFECQTNLYVDINKEICDFYSMSLNQTKDVELTEMECLDKYGQKFMLWKHGAKQPTTLTDTFRDIYNNFCDHLHLYYNKIKDGINLLLDKYPILKYLFIGGGILLTSLAIFKLYNSFKTEILQHDSEMISSPTSGQQKYTKKMQVEQHEEAYNSPASGMVKKGKKMFVEISSDQNASDLATGVLRNNTYALSYELNGIEKFIGNVTVVCGYNVLMPWHFFHHFRMHQLPLTTVFSMTRVDADIVHRGMIQFRLENICDKEYNMINSVRLHDNVSNLDAVIFTLNRNTTAHCHKDIVRHFIRKSELGRLHGNMKGLLPIYSPTSNGVTRCFKTVTNVKPADKIIEITSIDNSIYTQRSGYLYESDTTRGDCGSVLILKSNTLTNKLVGMHVSGAFDEGFAVKLTFEILKDGLDDLSKVVGHRAQMYLDYDSVIIEENCDIPKGCFNPIGKAAIPLHQCSRTVLGPSKELFMMKYVSTLLNQHI